MQNALESLESRFFFKQFPDYAAHLSTASYEFLELSCVELWKKPISHLSSAIMLLTNLWKTMSFWYIPAILLTL